MRRETQLEKLKNDLSFWEKKFSVSEEKYRKLLNSGDAFPKATINAILARLRRKDPDVGELVEEWISNHTLSLAEIFAKSAEMILICNSAGERTFEISRSRATVARMLDADNPVYLELQKTIDSFRAIVDPLSADPSAEFDCRSYGSLDEASIFALSDRFVLAFEQSDDLLAALLSRRILDELTIRNGGAHEDVARWENNLAVIFMKMGRIDDAYQLLQKCHTIAEGAFDRQTLAVHRINYGACLIDREEYGSGLQLLNLARPIAIEYFGADHQNVVACEGKMLIAYSHLKNYTAMLPLAESFLASDEFLKSNTIFQIVSVAIRKIECLVGLYDLNRAIQFAEDFSYMMESRGIQEDQMVVLDTLLHSTLEESGSLGSRGHRLKYVKSMEITDDGLFINEKLIGLQKSSKVNAQNQVAAR
ncbi:tetratricopeptide repeat protein [Rhizobium beringeri]|uniref:tetratricopeptide repeat protein n=1 Tax=Rhizobium beringeri TaxID=3019934 RepID=UPI002E0FDEF9|nr:tetratricopeptide repeat protein [Rhizobium beringeri]WSH79852.1 tetratricopeptide repeat protein [Rhizobium beringeri]